MTIARKAIVLDKVESTYHCCSRTVRRAFLCGEDRWSGQSFEHRKSWVKERLQELAGIFGLDVCGYAVMSNHLHVVVRTRPDLWSSWSDEEVAARWWRLFPKRRDEAGLPQAPTAQDLALLQADREKLRLLRERLGHVSWFMRCLNEHIARKANQEDNCKGRFWEGRFKCQALLDEAAELACMAYVDLNPIRAQVAKTPEASQYTSVKDRIDAKQAKARIKTLHQKRREKQGSNALLNEQQLAAIRAEQRVSKADQWLTPIGARKASTRRGILSLTQDQYLKLIDWTGRAIRSGKRGAIPSDLQPILERLHIDVVHWVDTVLSFGRLFYRVAGHVNRLLERAAAVGQAFFCGLNACRCAFSGPPPG